MNTNNASPGAKLKLKLLNMLLPFYDKNRRIGDKGVSIVKKIIEEKFNWLLRETQLKDDFGLDGYIDILLEGKYVTGKSIGIQIKTGHSYFKQKTKTGWTYTGNRKHINYYLNSNIPIIIIIVNPDTEECWWNKIDADKILLRDNLWKIEICKRNELNNKELLSSVAGKFINYGPQLEYLSSVKQILKDSGLVFIAIDKIEILEKNYEGLIILLNWLTSSNELIEKCRNKIVLFISGYDEDERELFEIEEIRVWMQKALDIFKYWGYFICMDEKNLGQQSSMRILMHCCTTTTVRMRNFNKKIVKVECSPEELTEFKNKIFFWLNSFTEENDIDSKINFEQSMLISKIIDNLSDDEIESIRKEYKFNI